MKLRICLYLLCVMAFGWFAEGCRGQVVPNPTGTTYTCPPSTGTSYTPLNPSALATGLTYLDTPPAAGVYCYIAQSEVTGGFVSNPSNIAGPFTTTTSTSSNSVSLNWVAPTTGSTPSGYVLSRAPAAATTVTANAPTLVTGTVSELRKDTPFLAAHLAGK